MSKIDMYLFTKALSTKSYIMIGIMNLEINERKN